jgi:hypothetical protein
MSSEENLRKLGLSINTLKDTADRLLAHAKAAVNDMTKVESLLTVKTDLDSAVLDCNHRFLDYKESLS